MYFVRECIRRHEAVIVVSYETGYLLYNTNTLYAHMFFYISLNFIYYL